MTKVYSESNHSSCCAPDGTCSSSIHVEEKSAFHFLSKLSSDQLACIDVTLKEVQEKDVSDQVAHLKNALGDVVPKYFLRKLSKQVESGSLDELCNQVKDSAAAVA